MAFWHSMGQFEAYHVAIEGDGPVGPHSNLKSKLPALAIRPKTKFLLTF